MNSLAIDLSQDGGVSANALLSSGYKLQATLNETTVVITKVEDGTLQSIVNIGEGISALNDKFKEGFILTALITKDLALLEKKPDITSEEPNE